METITTITQTRKVVANAKSQGKTIALVPTMGALHAGHISLIEAAKKDCDFIVVSIFVNPTQFGPTEDLDKYPRDLSSDQAKCEKAGADLIFAPADNEMYQTENITWVTVEKLTDNLCGKSRADHFRGVTTVCTKLFNIVQPHIAYFGQKDAQQAIVIKRMVADMNLPLKTVTCPIVREPDGLAMSSRNKYLSTQQRTDACLIKKALIECENSITKGNRNTSTLRSHMLAIMAESKIILPEYISFVDCKTLQDIEVIESKTLVAIAAKLGKTRLIDNIIVDAPI